MSGQRGFISLMPTTVLFGMVVALLFTNTLVWGWWQEAKDEHSHYVAAVEAVQEQVRVDNDRKLAEAETATQFTAEGFRAAVDYWRAHPRTVRVLPINCDPGTRAETPSTVWGTDASTAEPAAGAAVLTAGQCEARLNNAILDASQVIWLQTYIAGLCKAYGCE